MNFLGLDLSSAKTGWTLIEEIGDDRPPRITCGSFPCNVNARDYDDMCRQLGAALRKMIRDWRGRGIQIDVAGVEAPIRHVSTKRRTVHDLSGVREVEELATNPQTMVILPALSGACIAILDAFGIRAELWPVSTWRKFCIGRAYAPKGTPPKEASGWGKRETRKWAADLAMRHGFIVRNMDESDSVGIAIYTAVMAGSMPVRKMIAAPRRAA